MEKVEICCLKRIGDKSAKYKVIALEDKDVVTVGRALDVNVCLPSGLISRLHGILKKEKNNSWTVSDNKSLNGIYLNGKKLEPSTAYPLHEGDRVQFGVPPDKDTEAEFVWKFYSRLRVKKLKKSSSQVESCSSQLSDASGPAENSRKRGIEQHHAQPSTSSPRERSPKKSRLAPTWSPSEEMKRKLEEQDRKAQEKLAEQERKLQELQAQLQEKDQVQEKMCQELKEKEHEMQSRIKLHQEQLEEDRKQFEEEMKQKYKDELAAKESSLLERLSSEKDALLAEKKQIEESLQNEMKERLDEKGKFLEAELLRQKEDLDKVIQKKELQQKLLESELSETKTEKLKQEETCLRTREDILSNFAELMETELQCSICNELLIQATTLSCHHSYCALCIEKWLKVKKECPLCRVSFTSQSRSIMLDNYIDRMVEHLSDELKERRKTLVQERKDELAQREEEAKQQAAATPAAQGRGRGRQRGRANTRGRGRTRAGRGRAAAAPAPVPVPAEPPIVIESDHGDDSSDNSNYFHHSDSSNSVDSEEGYSGAYYGGYGYCFNCGRRGHWANGCPF